MSYNKYPKEMKEAIIARMLEGDETVTDIQRDTGVGILFSISLYKVSMPRNVNKHVES